MMRSRISTDRACKASIARKLSALATPHSLSALPFFSEPDVIGCKTAISVCAKRSWWLNIPIGINEWHQKLVPIVCSDAKRSWEEALSSAVLYRFALSFSLVVKFSSSLNRASKSSNSASCVAEDPPQLSGSVSVQFPPLRQEEQAYSRHGLSST